VPDFRFGSEARCELLRHERRTRRPLKEWAGQRSGPILMYNNEWPRAGWAEILLLSERLTPNPSLLPKDAAERALVFGLAHEICGEQGVAWSRRLQLIRRA
jgi:hypothetical protein